MSQDSHFCEAPDAPTRSAGRLPWFALQVRTRHELGIAEHIRHLGYEEFLPLYKCRKRWSDRIKEVDSPLFPGYLFCRLDPQYRLPILKIPGVMQIVGYNRQLIPVDEGEICAIQTLVASGLPNHPWPFMEVGEKVHIESGPLRGLEGVLAEIRGDRRFILSVSLLQRSVAVELDATALRPQRRVAATRSERSCPTPRPLPIVAT